MVLRETVTAAHDDVISMLEEAQNSGSAATPRWVRLLLILEKLTNLNPSEAEHPAIQGAKEAAANWVPPAPPAPQVHVPQPAVGAHNLEDAALDHDKELKQQEAPAKCPPHGNINQYGVCRDCGQCLHSLGPDGAGNCRNCGEALDTTEA